MLHQEGFHPYMGMDCYIRIYGNLNIILQKFIQFFSFLQISSLHQCHFMPINAAKTGSDSGLHMNGVKRKRTREKTVQSAESSSDDISPWHSRHHISVRHQFTGKNHKCHHGSRAPIAAEDKVCIYVIYGCMHIFLFIYISICIFPILHPFHGTSPVRMATE